MSNTVKWVYVEDFFELREAEDPVNWIPLVCKLSLRYTDQRPIQDSWEYSDGILGLLKAIEFHDPSKASFMTYAHHCIHNSIKTGYRLRRAKERLYDHEAFAPDPIDLFEKELDWFTPDEFEVVTSKLTAREDYIVRETLEGKFLREMAFTLGLTKERVRQIRVEAYTKLRREYVNKYGEL